MVSSLQGSRCARQISKLKYVRYTLNLDISHAATVQLKVMKHPIAQFRGAMPPKPMQGYTTAAQLLMMLLIFRYTSILKTHTLTSSS